MLLAAGTPDDFRLDPPEGLGGVSTEVAAVCAIYPPTLFHTGETRPSGSLPARVLPAEVRQVAGKLDAGAPQFAPYDLILIEGGVREIPGTLAAQLAPHGRIVTVIVPAEGVGTAVRADAGEGGLTIAKLFDCQTPALPSLLAKVGFSFD